MGADLPSLISEGRRLSLALDAALRGEVTYG